MDHHTGHVQDQNGQPTTDDPFSSPIRGSQEKIDQAAEIQQEATDYIAGFKLAAVLAGVTVIVFLVLLDQTIISTAESVITADLHALSDVGWYAGAYQLAR